MRNDSCPFKWLGKTTNDAKQSRGMAKPILDTHLPPSNPTFVPSILFRKQVGISKLKSFLLYFDLTLVCQGFVMNLQPSEAEAGFDVRVPPTADPEALEKRITEEWAPASRNMTFKVFPFTLFPWKDRLFSHLEVMQKLSNS